MSNEARIDEAIHVVTSLWAPDLIREVAEAGIITDLGGEAAIVSSAGGTILWRGGRILNLAWAVAFTAAARCVHKTMQSPE